VAVTLRVLEAVVDPDRVAETESVELEVAMLEPVAETLRVLLGVEELEPVAEFV
jgi:hypothetical protein